MSLLDTLIFGYRAVVHLGSELTQRSQLEFDNTFTVVDDPVNKRTVVSGGGGSSTPSGTGFRKVVGGIENGTASPVNLASSDVTSTLPVTKGGTGLTAIGSAYQNVRVNSGGTALEFAAVDLGTAQVTGTLPVGRQASQVMTGDVTGTTGANTVAKINGATVPAGGALTTGNSLKVTGAATLGYSAVNLAGGSAHVTGVTPVANGGTGLSAVGTALQYLRTNSGATALEWATLTTDPSLGGDLSGTASAATVAKVHGATVPAAGALTTGNGLYVSGASALSYSALNLAGGSAYVTGVLPTGNQASQSMGGDVSGTTASATVAKINGSTVPAGGALTTGNVLKVSGVSALSYGAVALGSGSDHVTGTLPVGNGGTGLTAVGTALQYLRTNAGATALEWATLSSDPSMGGDVSGTASAATVAKINGATVPAGGALTTGNTLYVSGVSALSYGALNLAGGSAYVTGTLPTGNQAAQSMGGDVSGTTASATVAKINGATVPAGGALTTGNGLYVSGVSALSYSALNLAGGSGYVTGALPVGNGGTGLTAIGTAYQTLRTNSGATALEFAAVDLATAQVTGTLTTGKGGTGLASIGTAYQTLRTNSGATALEFAAVDLATAQVTGTLTVGKGGTGLTAVGTALQVLRTNSGATALEWSDPGTATIEHMLASDASTSSTTYVNTNLSFPVTSGETWIVDFNFYATRSGTSNHCTITLSSAASSPLANAVVAQSDGLHSTADSADLYQVNAGATWGVGSGRFRFTAGSTGTVYFQQKCAGSGTTFVLKAGSSFTARKVSTQ